MNKKIKKTIIEAIIIILASFVIGIIYNYITEKPLPLITPEDNTSAIEDSLLLQKKTKSIEDVLNQTITYQQILRFKNRQDVIVIDARSPEQFAQGHIDNAINIFPLAEDPNEFYGKANSLPREKIIITYCDGGNCDLSHELAIALINFGFERVFLYKGGWEDWYANRMKKSEK